MSQMKSHKPRGYLYWLGILLAMLALPAWASDFSHGVLWKISKPGIASSYLFGTIHSDDARVTRLPPAVALAFANSQSFTGELDMSANSMTQTEKALLLPSGQTLKDIVGKARYQKCVNEALGHCRAAEHAQARV
ncbi:MAG: TraB/GumN family protein [Gammaproteobacteria bacterium]